MKVVSTVQFKSAEDGLFLEGWLFASEKDKGTIVMCHGRGDTKETFAARYKDLIFGLYRTGLSIFMFDFRGHGKSAEAPYSFGYFEQRDVTGAIEYLKTTKLNTKDLGILGFSVGACAAMLAAEKTSGIKALVAESGYSSYENVAIILDQKGVPVPKGTQMHRDAVQNIKKRAGWDFDIAPINGIDKLSPCALFLIDGEEEKEDNMLLFEKAKDPKQLWLVPGTGHGGAHSVAKEEYDKRVTKFFVEHL
jgi:uncharacterized protein